MRNLGRNAECTMKERLSRREEVLLDALDFAQGLNQCQRIDLGAMHAHGPVQVRARSAPGRAHRAEHLASGEDVAFIDVHFMEVAVHRYQAVSVVYQDRIAVEEEIARDYDLPRGGRNDWRPYASRDIEALMGIAGLSVQYSLAPEWAGKRPIRRQ